MLVPLMVRGQLKIPLSEKHRQKIEEIEDPRKKLRKYRQFYSKDSIKYLRQLDKALTKKSDSIYAAMRRLEHKGEKIKDKLNNDMLVQKGEDIGLPTLTPPGKEELPVPGKIKDQVNQVKTVGEEVMNKELPISTDEINRESGDVLNSLKGHDNAMQTLSLPDTEASPVPDKIKSPVIQAETMGKEVMDKQLPVSTDEINNKAAGVLNSSLGGQGEKVTELKNEATAYQGYYDQYKDYLNHPDSLQAMVEKLANEELEQAAEKMAEKGQGMMANEQFQQQKALAEEIRNTPEKYQQQLKQYGDQEFLKEEGRQKAKEKAVDFLAQHQDKISGVQKKIGKLKRVYSKVENSNDMSTAIKRNSLKGKPLKDRLFIGGDFQVINLDPFSLDFSPSLGYMFNKNFIMGLGGTYRHTFGEFESRQTAIPENQYAVNAFIRHDVIKGFFAFATYEQSNRELPDLASDESGSAWIPGFMAGVGKAISVHPRIDTSIMLLYNFLHESGQSPYRSPWIFKTGFQLKRR